MSDRALGRAALTRRQILIGTAGIGLMALPRWAQATPAEAQAAIAKITGGATPAAGRVTLRLPQIAENGNSVQFSVAVDSPMTEADYVKAIHVIAEENPFPEVATFYLSPANGKAEVTMRMRLAKTQTVRAVAVMADGKAFEAQQEVKVTIGGCGG